MATLLLRLPFEIVADATTVSRMLSYNSRAFVIDHLRTTFSTQKETVAIYYFFDFLNKPSAKRDGPPATMAPRVRNVCLPYQRRRKHHARAAHRRTSSPLLSKWLLNNDRSSRVLVCRPRSVVFSVKLFSEQSLGMNAARIMPCPLLLVIGFADR